MPIVPYQRETNDAPGLGFQPQYQASSAVAQGLSDLAGGIGNVASIMKERDDKAKAMQSAVTAAQMNNDLRDLHDQTALGIQNGSIPSETALSQFNEKASSIRDQAFSGLTQLQVQHLSPDYVSTSGGLARNLNVALAQRSQSEASAEIDRYGEQAQRSALRLGPAAASEKYADFVDFAQSNAGITPDHAQKMKQAFKESVFYTAFNSAAENAVEANDPSGLAEVRRQLNSEDGTAIDPQKRTMLSHRIFGYEQHVLAKIASAQNAADAEQLRRENSAVDMYNKVLDLSVSGKSLDTQTIKDATETVAGTKTQNDMLELLQKQPVIAGFATKPATQRASIINSLEADANANGTSPLAAKMVTQLHTLNDKVTAGYQNNPWQQAQTSGVILDAQTFDASKPDSAFGIVDARMKDIGKVDIAAGMKVSPFQPQEIVQLEKSIRGLPPEQAGPYLGQLGEKIGDLDRINMVAADLDKSNRPMSLAFKLGTDRSTAGRTASEFVLRGAQALKDKTVKADDTVLAGWRAEIAGKVRGTMGDQEAENDIIDSAYYVRAAFEQDGIQSPGYKLTQTNDNAIKWVIGLPMERAGVKTLLPRGMDESQFNDKLKTLTPDSLRSVSPVFYSRGNPIKPEQLANRMQEFGMRRDGTGRYIPSNNGAPITIDAAGANPLRIKVQ